MVTLPVKEYAIDLEFLSYPDRPREVIEIAIYDLETGKIVYQSYLKVSDPSSLTQWKKDHGYTEEKLRNGKSKEEVNDILKVLLPGSVCIFWNADFDLKHFPSISKYSLAVRCCMKRFSDRYGVYNSHFGNHTYVKLSSAAAEVGIDLDDSDFFHSAMTDAKVCGLIWNFLENQEITKTDYTNLVSRHEVLKLEEQYEKKLENKDIEIRKLQSNIKENPESEIDSNKKPNDETDFLF